MQNDREFPVKYKCECGTSHTIGGTSERQTIADFEALGWQNNEVSEGQFVEVCPDCATAYMDEALAMERAERAEDADEAHQEWLDSLDTQEAFLEMTR